MTCLKIPPIAQDALWPVSYVGVTGKWGLLSHVQNAVRCKAGASGTAGTVLAGPLFHSSKKKKRKKKFLVGFNQCSTAWQRKSSKYSNKAATVTPVSLQRASDNRSSVVSSTDLGVLHCGAGMRSRLGRGRTT